MISAEPGTARCEPEPAGKAGLAVAAGGCGRAERVAALLAGAIVVGVPFVAFTNLLLAHFYVTGSFLLDAGWTAYLIARGGLALHCPAAFGVHSYFGNHVSPILIAPALLGRFVPVSPIQFAAGFLGLCQALPALGVYWMLRRGLDTRGLAGTAAAALIAVLFAFNGESLAIVRYPHSEILVAGSMILFLAALALRQWWLATILFALALLTREDAGFHLFGILFIVMVLNRCNGVCWQAQRPEFRFAAIAFAYSLSVVAVQQLFVAVPSTFQITYLGAPPFASISAANVAQRALFALAYRPYLVLPALVAAIWAVATRNPYIFAGYIAVVPWTALQLVAHSNIAGTLSAYYAYPYLVAAFFPLVGVVLARQRGIGDTHRVRPAVAFVVVTLVSYVGLGRQYNPGNMDLLAGMLSPPSRERQAATDRALALLAQVKPGLGKVIADTSVVALAPDDFRPDQTIPRADDVQPEKVTHADTVILFAGGIEADAARQIAEATGLKDHYRVPGTAIRIATDRPLAAFGPLASLLAASPNLR
jgi:hypothetical protein